MKPGAKWNWSAIRDSLDSAIQSGKITVPTGLSPEVIEEFATYSPPPSSPPARGAAMFKTGDLVRYSDSKLERASLARSSAAGLNIGTVEPVPAGRSSAGRCTWVRWAGGVVVVEITDDLERAPSKDWAPPAFFAAGARVRYTKAWIHRAVGESMRQQYAGRQAEVVLHRDDGVVSVRWDHLGGQETEVYARNLELVSEE